TSTSWTASGWSCSCSSTSSSTMKNSVPDTAAPPFNRLLLLGVLGIGLVAVLIVAWRFRPGASSSGTRSVLAAEPDSAESFAQVQPFRLTERSGAEVTLDTLKGRPWVASFIFTRCSGPCPRMSASMKKVQGLLAGTDVRLVTFSVDPEYD